MVRDGDFLAGVELVEEKRLRKLIESANKTGTPEYKKEVVEEETKRTKNKRNLKNQPSKSNIKRRLKAVAVVAGLVLTGATGYTIAKVPEYKEEAFTSTLEAVKEEIAENAGTTPDKVQIKGVTEKNIRSGGEHTTYTLYIDGQRFEYQCYKSNQSGETMKMEDTIGNNEVLDAIATVVNAQGGNIFDAIKANRLRKNIESGKIDLKVVLRENSNKALREAGIDR